MKQVRHVEAQEGYDRWAETYDQTPNPVVSMDDRHALRLLAPKAKERILDAGCGTGRHFAALLEAKSLAFGIDYAPGMLRVAQRRYPDVPLALADLQRPLPLRSQSFEAVVCSLVGEHLQNLASFFREMRNVLKPDGRLLFSVYHPEMAAAGIEANFQEGDVEFRLGAFRHTVQDYLRAIEDAGFIELQKDEFFGDEELAASIPRAKKYLGFPLLLVVQAVKKDHRAVV